MEEIVLKKVNAKIYKETLNNGIEVYLYPFNETKNYYITISVNYGAKYTKYKKNAKLYEVIPGTAHFLEHKIMTIGEDPILSKKINEYGSLANAWTNPYGTNYNIYGSINIKENIEILLNLFHYPKFVQKDIDEEKGIIGEEIDMDKDNIGSCLYHKMNSNLFHKSYAKNTTLGEKTDIEKIDENTLNEIYNSFYVPNNTFIIITGNFDKDEVMNFINDYYKINKFRKKDIPKRIIEKEKEEVLVNYEEIKKDMEDIRIKYAIKIKKSDLGNCSDRELSYYLNIILKSNFGPTSKLYERYKNNNIINTLTSSYNIIDDYVIICISAISENPDIFIENIKKDILKLKLSNKEFERKKKMLIKTYISLFENIEDFEYYLCLYLLEDEKKDFKIYEQIINLKYEIAYKVMNKITFKNYSIIKTVK